MFAPTFISRTLPGLALAAAFTLTACSDHIDPIAPRSESEPTPNSFLGLPLTPPALTAEMQAALGNPEVPGGPMLSTTATASSASTGSAITASTSAQTLRVNGGGLECRGSDVIVRAPRPQGTQNFVQSFEWAWWYPVLLQWNGSRWVEVQILPHHRPRWGWAYTQLPNANPQWTSHESGRLIGNQVINTLPGYYAVVSWVYFGASQRWANQVESIPAPQSPIGSPIVPQQWCQTR